MVRIVFAIMVLAPIVAHAAPPSPGSDDDIALSPYAEWIQGQTGHYGGLCCSLADCRTVEWREHKGHVEALIARSDSRGFDKFLEAPNKWLEVPDVVIKREGNPTGVAIACWSAYRTQDDGFYCFFLPDLT